jgi:hypothetical protein
VKVSIRIHPQATRSLGKDYASVRQFVRSCLEEHRRLLAANGTTVRKNSPESAVTLVDVPGFPRVCVKEFRWRGWLHAVKGFFRPTQGLRTYRNGWRLLSAGFPVAAPLVLVRERYLGFIRSEWIIMEVLPAALEMDRYLVKRMAQNWCVEEKRALAMRFGRYIGTLHAEGIFHADLKTCNILVSVSHGLDDPEPAENSARTDGPSDGAAETVGFCLLDYDEVRFSRSVPTRKRLKNLAQIFLSTPLAIRATDRLRFLSEYALHVGASHRERREAARAVVHACHGRPILYVGFQGDVREPWER